MCNLSPSTCDHDFNYLISDIIKTRMDICDLTIYGIHLLKYLACEYVFILR